MKIKVFGNLILLAAALAAALFIAEFAAGKVVQTGRLAEKLENRGAGLPKISLVDGGLGWGYIPGARAQHVTSEYTVEYSINSYGNRDEEISLDKTPGRYRIVALGDSMVFGQGVGYGSRFTEVIERRSDKFQVINMGVWGYGADQSLLQLERDGFKFRPDLVVLFAINDDFKRCKDSYNMSTVAKPYFVLSPAKDGIIVRDMHAAQQAPQASAAAPVEDGRKPLLAGSKLMFLLDYKKNMQALDRKDRLDKLERQKREHDASGSQNLDASADTDLRALIYFILQRYSDVCKKNAADFILVHIDTDDPLHLEDMCRDLHIPYVDVSGPLVEAAKSRPLRFRIDPHYNVFAHKVIGEYVGDYLARKYDP
jgi:hypothetical protein